MSTAHPTVLVPCLHDLHSDANVSGTGLPDDPAAEMAVAFGYGTAADELTEREIDALFEADMARRDAEARRRNPPPPGWRECPCDGCGTAMLVRVETSGQILCPRCEASGNAPQAA